MRENRRAVMSKRLIKAALIDLLKKEPLSAVSVTELCRTADINRSTFYAHYLDIFDVLEDMEDDFIQKVSFSRMGNVGCIMLNQMRDLVSYTDKHRETYLALWKAGYLHERFLADWMKSLSGDGRWTVFSEKREAGEKYRASTAENGSANGLRGTEGMLADAMIRCAFYSVNGLLQEWLNGKLALPYQELSVVLLRVIEKMQEAYSPEAALRNR